MKRFAVDEIQSIDSKIMNESMPISMNYFEKDEIQILKTPERKQNFPIC